MTVTLVPVPCSMPTYDLRLHEVIERVEPRPTLPSHAAQLIKKEIQTEKSCSDLTRCGVGSWSRDDAQKCAKTR